MKIRVISLLEFSITQTLAILISSKILILNFTRIRKSEEVFINYRAFGHSISDTNAFLTFKEKNRLCISVGDITERNPYFASIVPRERLIQIILPKPQIIGKQSLRKAVGLKIYKYISLTQKKWSTS